MRKLITAATIVASLATLAVPAVSMASNGQTAKMTGNSTGYVDGTWGRSTASTRPSTRSLTR